MRFSGATKRNPNVADWSRKYQNLPNSRFFQDGLKALGASVERDHRLIVFGFLGQRDIPGVTLRHAQSVLRWDQRPSLWSHVFLIPQALPLPARTKNVPLREVALFPRSGVFPKPEANGVIDGSLPLYNERKLDANVALVAVRVSPREARVVRNRALNPNVERLRYDLWGSLGRWQRYLWSDGSEANPLRVGTPMFCASFIEMCFAAIELDITPAASEQNSAPEHLWSAAMWWHDAFEEFGHAVSGCYVLRDRGCALLGTEEL